MGAVKSKSIAVGGLLAGLTLLCLFLATVMPTNRLSLYALSSFPTAVIVLEYGIKRGWMFYGASSLLALILIPNKLAVVPFVVFFGIYGAVKYHIERIRNVYIEYAVKLVYFNIWLGVALVMVREFFLDGNTQLAKFPLWVLVVALEVVFVIYDYVYTLFIQYYNTKLKKMLKI